MGAADPAFPVEVEVARAREHVARCGPCQEFFAAEQQLRDFLKVRVPRESPPASLREKVLAAIARQGRESAKARRRFGFLRPPSVALVLAALLAIVIAGSLWLRQRPAAVSPQQLASALIDDHAHSLPSEAEVASSDHEVVQSWFDGKLDFSFHLPPASDPALIGGRLCNLQGRSAALVFYQQPGSRISLFVFDGSDVVLPQDQSIAIDGKRCLIDSKKGFNAVMWKERGVLYGLVSDARGVDLLQLAAQF